MFDQKVNLPGIDTLEMHYTIYDKTGAGIIIEFTNNRRAVYENTVGVCTKSPPYDFHMINLRNYVELKNTAHEPLHLGGDVSNNDTDEISKGFSQNVLLLLPN